MKNGDIVNVALPRASVGKVNYEELKKISRKLFKDTDINKKMKIIHWVN